ncbi:hypothetical protein CPB86DRAFT_149819 [Serendipita vermifera]|nr:hypothetical protein CPB86DRAFT_149819 [Serendipita vermifera]
MNNGNAGNVANAAAVNGPAGGNGGAGQGAPNVPPHNGQPAHGECEPIEKEGQDPIIQFYQKYVGISAVLNDSEPEPREWTGIWRRQENEQKSCNNNDNRLLDRIVLLYHSLPRIIQYGCEVVFAFTYIELFRKPIPS